MLRDLKNSLNWLSKFCRAINCQESDWLFRLPFLLPPGVRCVELIFFYFPHFSPFFFTHCHLLNFFRFFLCPIFFVLTLHFAHSFYILFFSSTSISSYSFIILSCFYQTIKLLYHLVFFSVLKTSSDIWIRWNRTNPSIFLYYAKMSSKSVAFTNVDGLWS